MKDAIEKEYERAIDYAVQRGDNESAFELSIGLKQYKELYKLV